MLHMLEQKSTAELDEILQNELRKDPPDGDVVREILRILEEREKHRGVELTPQIQAAWDKFKADDQRRTDRPEPTARSWVKKAAAVVATAAVLCVVLLGVIPQPAKADTLWEIIIRFTDSVVEFVSWEQADEKRPEYEFKTNNPGLQEVYEAVLELGVTDPVVPMWLPEGYKLAECVTKETYAKTGVTANFMREQDMLIYKVEIFNSDMWHEYHKDESDVSEYEMDGVVHKIMQNKGRLVAIWERETVECYISVIGDEDDLYRVINSIYTKTTTE